MICTVTTEVHIKDCNHMTEAVTLFHWCALGLCWNLDIDVVWRLALTVVIVFAMWYSVRCSRASAEELRCLWLGPGDAVSADVGGLLHTVECVEPKVLLGPYVEFHLHCIGGERIKARVFGFGVSERGAFRDLYRRLNTGVAW